MICRQKKPDRSCAPVSPFTTHCGIQVLAPERWWQFRASAVSAISVCNTRGKWDFTPSRSGTARDSQDTLEFSALTGVHPMIEKFPLSRVAEAYEQMHSGKVRFRAVLTVGV